MRAEETSRGEKSGALTPTSAIPVGVVQPNAQPSRPLARVGGALEEGTHLCDGPGSTSLELHHHLPMMPRSRPPPSSRHESTWRPNAKGTPAPFGRQLSCWPPRRGAGSRGRFFTIRHWPLSASCGWPPPAGSIGSREVGAWRTSISRRKSRTRPAGATRSSLSGTTGD